MPDLRAYDGGGEWAGHVQTIGIAFQRGRRGSCAQRLHQMWPDLGRLDAIAEILQVGPFLGHDPEKHALGQKRVFALDDPRVENRFLQKIMPKPNDTRRV
jgi:hypothetical protein